MEAPRRHPGGPQEVPGGTKGTRQGFDATCVKTNAMYKEDNASDRFCAEGSDVTLAKSAACTQNERT